MSDFEFDGFVVQSIEMKYIGPTNRRNARIRAVTPHGGKRIEFYDSELTVSQNCERVALMLAKELEWISATRRCKYAIGSTREGYVMTFYQ